MATGISFIFVLLDVGGCVLFLITLGRPLTLQRCSCTHMKDNSFPRGVRLGCRIQLPFRHCSGWRLCRRLLHLRVLEWQFWVIARRLFDSTKTKARCGARRGVAGRRFSRAAVAEHDVDPRTKFTCGYLVEGPHSGKWTAPSWSKSREYRQSQPLLHRFQYFVCRGRSARCKKHRKSGSESELG